MNCSEALQVPMMFALREIDRDARDTAHIQNSGGWEAKKYSLAGQKSAGYIGHFHINPCTVM